jgi:hypothetical protein
MDLNIENNYSDDLKPGLAETGTVKNVSVNAAIIRRIRTYIGIMITGLFLSGVTAFPIETELAWLVSKSNNFSPAMAAWLQHVYHAVQSTNSAYPFLAYGTDWLAFAHVMLGVLFVGPLRNPVRNIWVIEFGMIACVAILPLAFIAGPLRTIPLFWQLIDCSFGLLGIIPLWLCYRDIKKLQNLNLIIK